MFRFMVLNVPMNLEEFSKAMAEKKISQAKMARDIGMNPSRLSDMISGRLKGWKYRRRISQYLGVPEETLFPDDGQHKECQTLNQ
jgi:transcriptional regulator with XRE-family HTH domain